MRNRHHRAQHRRAVLQRERNGLAGRSGKNLYRNRREVHYRVESAGTAPYRHYDNVRGAHRVYVLAVVPYGERRGNADTHAPQPNRSKNSQTAAQVLRRQQAGRNSLESDERPRQDFRNASDGLTAVYLVDRHDHRRAVVYVLLQPDTHADIHGFHVDQYRSDQNNRGQKSGTCRYKTGKSRGTHRAYRGVLHRTQRYPRLQPRESERGEDERSDRRRGDSQRKSRLYHQQRKPRHKIPFPACPSRDTADRQRVHGARSDDFRRASGVLPVYGHVRRTAYPSVVYDQRASVGVRFG